MILFCLFLAEREIDPKVQASNLNVLYIIIGVAAAVVISVFGIIVMLKRKRVYANTWYPDNTKPKSAKDIAKPGQNRKGPDGEEMQ